MIRVVLDRARCSGHALCLLHAPELFDHDDDGLAIVVQAVTADAAAAHEAEQNCPERAIRLEELA